MGAKTFMWTLAAVAVVGGAVGAGAYAVTGNDDAPAATASEALGLPPSGEAGQPGALPSRDRQQDGAGAQPETSQTAESDSPADSTEEAAADANAPADDGAAARPERIAGVVNSIDSSGVVLATDEGPVAVTIAGDVPVQLAKTVADAVDDLVVGVEVTAVLARTEAGVVARNIAIGGAGTGGLAFGGGGRQGGGAGANVVTGTIASVGGGTLVIDTAEGPAEVALGDDTPVLITRSFADAAGDLSQGTEITVVGQRTDDGGLQAIAVTTGALGPPGAPRGGGGRGRGGQ